jgi:hypothetical protein
VLTPRRGRHLTGIAVTVGTIMALALASCGAGDDGDTTTTEVAPTLLTTMAPSPTADLGDESVPGGRMPEGGTDTTVTGAVPGQDVDRLNPPDEGPTGGRSRGEADRSGG